MINIYQLIDPETYKIRYIGQTTQTLYDRYGQHCRTKGRCHIDYWVRSLIAKGLKPIVELITKVETQDDANFIEILLIAYYKSIGYQLTNHDKGGKYGGRNLSEETKMKISAAHIGYRHSEEAKAKMSAGHKGKTLSEEHRLRIGIAGMGRQQSEATKSKRIESNGLYRESIGRGRVERTCKVCSTTFTIKCSKAEIGRGVFCSKKCANIHQRIKC